MALFNKLKMLRKEIENRLETMEFSEEFGMGSESEESSVDLIVNDYVHLIKKICKRKPIASVELFEEDYAQVKVNGQLYDLDMCIKHNDLKNTERMMEIEALFCDGVCFEEVQTKLRERFITSC